MQQMFHSAKRPFYQSTQTQVIKQIDKEEYYRFAAKFFVQQKRELDRQTFDYLYDKFEGHTWYVQTLLNRLYEYTDNPDVEMVDYAICEIISELKRSYSSM